MLTVTPLVQEDYRKMTSTPVYMIPNGFDGEDFKAPVHFDGYFNITQTGVMSADGNPSAFWKILGAKAARDEEFRSALRIRFCGVIDAPVLEEIKREGLEPNLVLLGYRSHAEAILEQRQASLLLLPLRDAPEMKIILPGKLFEYLAARRPVLGFGQSDGAQARLLQETGAGITADWTDTKAMEDFLEKAWAAHKAGGVPATTGNIDQYERRALTRELAALLEKV